MAFYFRADSIVNVTMNMYHNHYQYSSCGQGLRIQNVTAVYALGVIRAEYEII